jgi:hypothetical protein
MPAAPVIIAKPPRSRRLREVSPRDRNTLALAGTLHYRERGYRTTGVTGLWPTQVEQRVA